MDHTLPPGLRSSDPRAWLAFFGPGAVVASLTIGSGELIFSSRGGAIFGYPLLGFFLLVCILKWALMYATARHMLVTGAHPFERWAQLPGPRSWLPLTFLLLGIATFPVWAAFHSGVLGTLAAKLLGGQSLYWALLIISLTTALAFLGGYERLEKIQLYIVGSMLLVVALSLFLIRPHWLAMLGGFLPVQGFTYPDWVAARPDFQGRPPWVELATYVGVIGGSGYDYLAYLSFLRDKEWGQSAQGLADEATLADMARQPQHPNRLWWRAALVDSVLSFLAVMAFTLVFVACGREVLSPLRQLPSGDNLLTLQSQFVEAGSSKLFVPLYFIGAFLAMFGTLYGTIETAPVVMREIIRALRGPEAGLTRRARHGTILWVGGGGLLVLVAMLLAKNVWGRDLPLVAMLTPAVLFTSVLACGMMALLSNWTDRRFLPRALRPPLALSVLVWLAALVFFLVGVKAYFDKVGHWTALVLAGPVLLGCLASLIYQGNKRGGDRQGPASD